MAGPVISIPIDRIHLYEENPRHERMSDPEKIRTYLCKDEQVLELAQSIADRKTNPLELIGVVRIDDEQETGEPTYEVWEGNRRVCALQLLMDPELAPAKWKKKFKELAASMDPITEVEGRVFDDRAELRFWMQNIHNGSQEGRGRKSWGPDEQHRDNPTRKNAIAFVLLERAQRHGLISKEERRGTLTTFQRYVGSKHFRPVLKVDDTDPSNVEFKRTEKELTQLLRILIPDLKEGRISSRHDEDTVKNYAAALMEKAGLTPKVSPSPSDPGTPEVGGGERAKPYSDGHGGGTSTSFPIDGADTTSDVDDLSDDKAAPRPKMPVKVKVAKDLMSAIEATGNEKLGLLYHSLTRISAKDHTPLIAIGCWALLETCAKECGANPTTPFIDFFSPGYMGRLGIHKKAAGPINDALVRISRGGNATKHHSTAATLDFRSLINDMQTVAPMLAKALTTKLV